MNLIPFIYLIFFLFHSIQAQRTPSDFYSKIEVNQLGYVYGKGAGHFPNSSLFNFWIYEFFAPDAKDFSFQLKLVGNGTTNAEELVENCTRILEEKKIECIVGLDGKRGMNKGNMYIHGTGKNGIFFLLFHQDYDNFDISKLFGCNKVAETQCMCGSGRVPTTSDNCDVTVPSPCCNLKRTAKPTELSEHSVLALKIQFKEPFDEDSIEETSLFVYDDSNFKYYALSYGLVPDEVDGKPYTNDKFRMMIRIGEIADELNPPKQNYIITNFEVDGIIDFRNAFCKKVDDRSVVCACCECSERDAFCKADHGPYAVRLYGSHKFTRPAITQWIVGAKAWTSRDKKRFHVQFQNLTIELFNQQVGWHKLTYTNLNAPGSSTTKETTCYHDKPNDPCFLELNSLQSSGYVSLEFCIFGNDHGCFIMFKWRVNNYVIEVNPGQCMISKVSDDIVYCACAQDVGDVRGIKNADNVYCRPSVSNRVINSGSNIFRLNIPSASIDFPLKEVRVLALAVGNPNVSFNRYIIRMAPVKVVTKEHVETGWPTDIIVARGTQNQVLETGASLTLFTNYPNINYNPYEFMNSSCLVTDDGSQKSINCLWCNENYDNCAHTTEYEFYFAKNLPNYGYLIGSGFAWTDSSLFFYKIDYSYLEDKGEGGVFVAVSGDTKNCESGKYCQVPNVGSVINLKFKYGNAQLEPLVGFEMENKEIHVTDSSGCDMVTVETDHIYCVCRSGMRTDANCPIQTLIQQCNSQSNNPSYEPPKLSFTSENFQKEGIFSKQTIRYVSSSQDSSLLYRMSYEPVQQIITQHPNDDPVFLMNITLAKYKGTIDPDFPIQLTNFNPTHQLFTLSQAFCKKTSLNKVECTCCEGYRGSNEEICLNAVVVTRLSIKFSAIIQDYGFMLAQFRLTLNSREFFTVKGEGEPMKQFDQKFHLTFLQQKGQNGLLADKQSCQWPECLFKFNSPLEDGDVVQFGVELIKSDGTVIGDIRQIDNFDVEGKAIKQKAANGDECFLYEQADGDSKSCSCPRGHESDATCGKMGLLECQQIKKLENVEIKGKTRKFASFYLQMGDPGEENPVFVFDSKSKQYYTFAYEWNESQDPTKSPSYKVLIGPTKSTQKSTSTIITTNFNVSSDLLIFNDVSCSFNNHEWFCECCSGSECNYKNGNEEPNGPDIDVKTTTLKPGKRVTAKPVVKPKVDPCKKNPTAEETTKLCDVKKSDINNETMNNVVAETKKAVAKNASADDITVASEIFVKLADVKNATKEQRRETIALLDHVLEAKEKSFKRNGRETSDNYLSSMDKILSESEDEITYLSGSNLGAQKKQLDCNEDGGWTGILDDSQEFKIENGGIQPGDGVASIELNKKKLCENGQGKQSVYFVIYRNGKLFQGDEEDDDEYEDDEEEETEKSKSWFYFDTETDGKEDEKEESSKETTQKDRCKKGFDPTNGFILTSVVSNKDAAINARLRFKKEDFKLPSHSNLAVTWWDKTEWSENKQCTFKLEGDEYVAHCDHLTNFALLVEKSSTDPMLCDTILDKLGFWLSILSLVCLFILALIYLTRLIPIIKDSIFVQILNNNRRKGADTLIVAYVLVMLMFYLFFAVFVDEKVTKSKGFCKFTAAFLYFLFLSSIILNLFQAWEMIKMCAWNSRIESIIQFAVRIYVALPISFGLPFLIVIIVFFADPTFFFRNDQFCWIRPQSVIFAVLIPVTLMLLNSFTAFTIFCVRMFPDFFKRLGIKGSSVKLAKGEKQARQMNLELFIVLLFAQFILGFPWILQYPAMFSSESNVWHYLFAIFNGTNGLILFFIYFYGRAMAFYRIHKNNSSLTSGVTQTETA